MTDDIQKLQDQVAQLTKQVKALEGLFNYHKHLGTDKSRILDGDILLKLSSTLGIGKSFQGYAINNLNLSSEQDSFVESINVDIQNHDLTFSRTGEQFQWTNSPNDGSNNNFFQAYGAPFVTSSLGTLVQGGSTFTDIKKSFVTDELVGEVLYISSADGSTANQEGHVVASNTATTITINGTFSANTGQYLYSTSNFVYLGSANFPWRRLNLYGDTRDGTEQRAIRMGFGASGGKDVIWIIYGAENPNGNVTANPGSIFLNTLGGVGATLFVKESGVNTNTGWIGK